MFCSLLLNYIILYYIVLYFVILCSIKNFQQACNFENDVSSEYVMIHRVAQQTDVLQSQGSNQADLQS
jgi:hypothetical protein